MYSHNDSFRPAESGFNRMVTQNKRSNTMAFIMAWFHLYHFNLGMTVEQIAEADRLRVSRSLQ